MYRDYQDRKRKRTIIFCLLGGILILLLAAAGTVACFFLFRQTPAAGPDAPPESAAAETTAETPPEPARPEPSPEEEAAKQREIAVRTAAIRERREQLFPLFYQSLRSGDPQEAGRAFDEAAGALEKLPEDASEEEKNAAMELVAAGVMLQAARREIDQALQLLFSPDSKVIGMQYELPDQKIGRVVSLDRRAVKIQLHHSEETRLLHLNNRAVNRELLRRAARRLQRPELEFLLTLAIGFPTPALADKAPTGFWKDNFAVLLERHLPLEEETAANKTTVLYTYDDLARAIYNSQTERAGNMIEAGADPNAADSLGSTVLMAAAGAGNLEIARLLLEKKADVNARSKTGRTALMDAVANNHPALVKLLLDAGAGLEATDKVTGKTIRQQAVSPEIIGLLKNAGKPAR